MMQYSQKTLVTSAINTTAETKTFTAVTDLGTYQEAQFVLALTDAKAAAGDTLDVYVDTYVAGAWINIVHFPQILGNGADAITHHALVNTAAAPAATTTDSTSDCAVGVTRPSVFGDRLRVRHVLVDGGAHGQSFTYSVTAFLRQFAP